MPGRTIESRERSRKTRRTKRLQNDQQHHKQPSQPQTSTQKCEKHIKTSRSFIFIHSKCRNQQPRKGAFQSSVKSSRLLDNSGTISQTSSNDEPNDDPNKRPQTSIFRRFPKISKDFQRFPGTASWWGFRLKGTTNFPSDFKARAWPFRIGSQSGPEAMPVPLVEVSSKCITGSESPNGLEKRFDIVDIARAALPRKWLKLYSRKITRDCFFLLLFGGFDKSNYDFGPIKTQKYPLACIEAGHDVQTRLYTAASHHSRTHGQSTQIFQDAWQTARTDP